MKLQTTQQRWHRSLGMAWVGLVLFGALGASSAGADRWYVHYDRAQEAIAAEDWSGAIEQINESLARRGDSGARVRSYGMNLVDYFPYLDLGVAYYHLGQFDAAIQAFETEERMAAISTVPSALERLESYRQDALDRRDQLATELRTRSQELVQEELATARRLEAEGRLQEAMAALDRTLALEGENQEAQTMLARLRSELLEADAHRARQQAHASLLAEAESALSSGDAGLAAARLRKALELEENESTRALLEQAQATIRNEVEAAERTVRIDSALNAARRLAGGRDLEGALERLELVFAVDPENRTALDLREQWVEQQASDRARRERNDRLAEAEAALAAGRPEEALTSANLLLAARSGDALILDLVRRAYAVLSRQLLRPGGTLPPAIRFADLRVARDDMPPAQVVDRSSFRLTGVVIDRSEVRVEADVEGIPVQVQQTSQNVGDDVITEFSVASRLGAGETGFRIRATADSGLSSSSEYRVVYSVPWHRSPVWRLAIFSGVMGLVLAGLGYRTLMRRRRRRRRFNPYTAGVPIFDPDLFFGREPIVRRVLQSIHNNSLLLHGERRIGKTSLLHQIRARLDGLDDPEFAFYTSYVDLQGVEESWFFATLGSTLRDSLEPALGASVDPPAAPLDQEYDHHHLQTDLRRWIRALESLDSRQVKVVLLIDEVDELNHYHPRVNQRLRSLFMKRFSERLAAVVAGVNIRRHWEREGSPWYNFFEEISVDPIALEDALQLVTVPLAGMFRIQAGVAERIAEISQCKPYLVQKLCLALVNRLHDQGRDIVTLEDVEAVKARVDGP
ncbi:MAG: AAA family ATPase [Thermoanaerobaculia bacterium]|nr:AAA family ATPase [Thermoanaerobaculia bacterium]